MLVGLTPGGLRWFIARETHVCTARLVRDDPDDRKEMDPTRQTTPNLQDRLLVTAIKFSLVMVRPRIGKHDFASFHEPREISGQL